MEEKIKSRGFSFYSFNRMKYVFKNRPGIFNNIEPYFRMKCHRSYRTKIND